MSNNFGAKILGNAVSSLNAQQAIIANSSNNIANVNTDGYTRRKVVLETRVGAGGTGLSLGNGVQVADVQRISDKFLEGILRDSIGDQSSAETQEGFMGRIEALFSLGDGSQAIGPSMTQFFNAIEDLKTDPSSIELRSTVLQRSEDLVESIQSTFNGLASMQAEANERLSNEVDSINSLTHQIAEINTLVETRESTGVTAADERDQRDRLLNKLAEKLSFTVLETNNGSINISLSNGFPLVTGATVRDLEAVDGPSFGTAKMLNGENMNYIVYDYDQSGAAPAHIDLTSIIANGSGSVSGLLEIRGTSPAGAPTDAMAADGSIMESAARIESITRTLLGEFNAAYRGPDLVAGGAHQASSGDLNGASPGVFGFFNVAGLADADADGLASQADINVYQAANAGNVTLSDKLTLVLQTPEDVAAALDDGTTPAVVTVNPGDSRNLDRLTAIRTNNYDFSAHGFTQVTATNSTIEELYNETVNDVGNRAARAQIDASVSGDNRTAVQQRRDELSAVSLDEEFSNLIQFQRAFEASARMIKIADEMLQQIIQIV